MGIRQIETYTSINSIKSRAGDSSLPPAQALFLGCAGGGGRGYLSNIYPYNII